MYKYILTVMIKEWNAIGTDLLIRRFGCSVFRGGCSASERRLKFLQWLQLGLFTSSFLFMISITATVMIFYVTDGGVLNKWRYIDG